MVNPAKHHEHTLRELLRYLRSTVTEKLRYGPGDSHDHFLMYSDGDWADEKSDRKSVSGS